MLVKCPECELQISDKAAFCPHCGFTFKEEILKYRKPRKSNRRKRLPNGFGQISEIKNKNLRKRFRAMVPVGKDSQGRFISKPLKPESFFETYNDAYAALVEYNKNPYDLDLVMTVCQLYEKWSAEYFKTLESPSSIRNVKSAWSYCSSVYDMRVSDIRSRHIKGCMEEGFIIVNGEQKKASAGTKERIKSMFNIMLDYALEYDIVQKNYARTFSLSDDIIQEQEENKRGHIPFTDSEIKTLWENVDKIPYVDLLLIQTYSGWRPQEIGLIELDNVDLENGIFSGGMKTPAGKGRIVPIHSKIRPLVEKYHNEATQLKSKYLFNCTDTHTHRSNLKMTYDKYRSRCETIRDALKLNPLHRAHDGRMHFVTQAKKYNVDEYAIKYIVGHRITDVTEKVYTQRDVSWLREEIEKIP